MATVCYGSYYANEVCEFRDFRDNTLNNYSLGKIFIKLYYKYSPAVSDKIKPYKTLNKSIRVLILNPLLKIIKTFRLNKKTHPNNVYKK
ncbi:MAG: CFI-box-CTERM domain-containing protein [Polaribacter sp.]